MTTILVHDAFERLATLIADATIPGETARDNARTIIAALCDDVTSPAPVDVVCTACGERFRWIGAPAGLSGGHPTVSVDEFTLHAPLRPASSDPDFGLGIPGFAITMREG